MVLPCCTAGGFTFLAAGFVTKSFTRRFQLVTMMEARRPTSPCLPISRLTTLPAPVASSAGTVTWANLSTAAHRAVQCRLPLLNKKIYILIFFLCPL